VDKLPKDVRLSLFHSNVKTIDVPDKKPGAADRVIHIELDRYKPAHNMKNITFVSGFFRFTVFEGF